MNYQILTSAEKIQLVMMILESVDQPTTQDPTIRQACGNHHRAEDGSDKAATPRMSLDLRESSAAPPSPQSRHSA